MTLRYQFPSVKCLNEAVIFIGVRSCGDIADSGPIGHVNTKARQRRSAVARWQEHLSLFAFALTSALRTRKFQPSD